MDKQDILATRNILDVISISEQNLATNKNLKQKRRIGSMTHGGGKGGRGGALSRT